MALLSFRSLALWILGYPDRALADANHAIMDAREMGQAATLMYALTVTATTLILCGHYYEAKAQSDEVARLAEEKGAILWKGYGIMRQGYVMALTGRGRSPHDHLGHYCLAFNGINIMDALFSIAFGHCLCGTSPI